jgi:hypothetical protein
VRPQGNFVRNAKYLCYGGQHDGYAELRIVDDRTLKRRDIGLMMPPVEIHSFRALTDDTFVLTVVERRYKPNRHKRLARTHNADKSARDHGVVVEPVQGSLIHPDQR